MVDMERCVPSPLTSFFGLGGEQRFRGEIARVTATAGASGAWLDELGQPLHELVPYDCAVLAAWDEAAGRYTPVLVDGDTAALSAYLRTDTAVDELRLLSTTRNAWPVVLHRAAVGLARTAGWRDHLGPAGFHDGLVVGLFTEGGRHVGLLALLTYRPQVVTVTAAALLHGVNALLASALEAAPDEARTVGPPPCG